MEKLQVKYKDAVIIYLNGSIVYAGNTPSGGYYSNQDMGASNTVHTIEENIFYNTGLSQLREGENILSVELHRKDETTTDMFFQFSYLRLAETEKKEYIPDTKGLILLQGKEMDEIVVNWVTNSKGSYKLEYMEKPNEQIRKSTFSNYANSVIMGSEELKDEEKYINSGTLTRLKPGTDYLYRVIQFGGKKASQIYEFTTADTKKMSFVFLGTIEENEISAENWEGKLKKGLDLCGGSELVIIGKDKTVTTDMGFTSAMELKKIPVIITASDQKENQYRAYSDMIFINIDGKNKDYEENKKFMEELIRIKNRKWSIVMMNTSIFEDNGEMKAKYEDLFRDLDVDIVLDRGTSYSRYRRSDKGLETEDLIKKVKGQTIYLTGGVFIGNGDSKVSTKNKKNMEFQEDESCIIKIESTREEITIKTYRIHDGKKVDSVKLIKSE